MLRTDVLSVIKDIAIKMENVSIEVVSSLLIKLVFSAETI